MVITELAPVIDGELDCYGFGREVDRFDGGFVESRALEHFAHGVNDVAGFEIAGGDFVEHGSEESEIGFVDERDLVIGLAGEGALQAKCGVEAGETGAEDEDSGCGVFGHDLSHLWHRSGYRQVKISLTR
jgi:hypothetical protein